MTRNVNAKRRPRTDDASEHGGDAGLRPPVPDQATLLRVAEEVRSAFPHPPETAELVVIDVDPRHLHAFWDIPVDEAASARARLDGDGETAPLVLRLTALDALGTPLGRPFDIEVIGLHGQFYVDIWDQPRRYQAVLGLRRGDGSLLPLAAPAIADLPPLAAADDRTWREIAVPPPVEAAALALPAAIVPAPATIAPPLPAAIAPTTIVPAPAPAAIAPTTIVPARAAAAAADVVRPQALPTLVSLPAAANDGDERETLPPLTAVAAAPLAPAALEAAPPWAEPAAIEHALAAVPGGAAAAAAEAATVVFAGHAEDAGRPSEEHLPAPAGAVEAPPTASIDRRTADETGELGGAPVPPAVSWRPLEEPFPLPPGTPADLLPDGLTSHWPFPEPPLPGSDRGASDAAPGAPETGEAPAGWGADGLRSHAATTDEGPPALPLESVVTVSSFIHGDSSVEFEINAELHIFGRARPGSTLSLHGQPVAVRPDGTFSVSRPLPQGALVLSLLVGRDGGQSG